MIGWCASCRTSQWGVRPLLRGEVRRRAFLVANHPTSLKLFQHETIFKFKFSRSEELHELCFVPTRLQLVEGSQQIFRHSYWPDALHDLCSRKTATKQMFKAMNRRRVASALQSAGGRSVALPVGKVGINFCLNFCSCTLKRLCPRFSF